MPPFPLSEPTCRFIARSVLDCLLRLFPLDCAYRQKSQALLANVRFSFSGAASLLLCSNGVPLGFVPGVSPSRPSHLMLCPPIMDQKLQWIDPILYLSDLHDPSDGPSVLVHELIHLFSCGWKGIRTEPNLILQAVIGISETVYTYNGTDPSSPVFDRSLNAANEILTDFFAKTVFEELFHRPYAFSDRFGRTELGKQLSFLPKETLLSIGKRYFEHHFPLSSFPFLCYNESSISSQGEEIL